ncbi:Plant self-incompatibility protein S1 family [Euphorbia peplus]|nr:Plant self-incompatibility protein S1 family [Euphorbia peplus]
MKIIAFYVLIVSLIFSSIPKFGLAKTTVIIHNDVGPGEIVKVHCKSKDDDLGIHVVQFNQSYQWRFRVDWMDRTLFFCGIATRHGSGIYDIYKAKRDFRSPWRRCPHTCTWKVRNDGAHGFEEFGNEDLFFAWKNVTRN